MNVHKNARLTPHSRAELVRRILAAGQTSKAVAMAFGGCPRTVRKWVERNKTHGEVGLMDRSSSPQKLRRQSAVPAAAAGRGRAHMVFQTSSR